MMKAVIRPKGEMRDSKIEWMKMIPNEWTTPKLLYVLRNKISEALMKHRIMLKMEFLLYHWNV